MTNLEDALLDAKLFAVKMVNDYYEDIIHFLTTGKAQDDYNTIQNKQLVVKYVDFQLIARQLYKMGPQKILRHRVYELPLILAEAHDGVA